MSQHRVDQGDDLQTFTKTHAMSQDTSGARMFFDSLNRFKRRVPHKLDSFHLMGLQFGHKMLVNRYQLGFSLGIEIQHQLINLCVNKSQVSYKGGIVQLLTIGYAPLSVFFLFSSCFRFILSRQRKVKMQLFYWNKKRKWSRTWRFLSLIIFLMFFLPFPPFSPERWDSFKISMSELSSSSDEACLIRRRRLGFA